MELTKEQLGTFVKETTEPLVKSVESKLGETKDLIEKSIDERLEAATKSFEEKIMNLSSTGVEVAEAAPEHLIGGGFFKSVRQAQNDTAFRHDFLLGLEKLYTNDKTIDKTLSGSANSVYDSDGGFLLHPTQSQSIMEKTYETGQLAADCGRMPVGPESDSVTFNSAVEDDRSTQGSVMGVRAFRKAQAAAATSSKPEFDETRIKLDKMMIYVTATDEMLKDSVFLEAFINRTAPKAFGKQLDYEIMSGAGTGECLGLLNSSALVSVAKETSQTADTINYNNVVKMRNHMPPELMRGAKWYINQEALSQLDLMTLTDGTGTVPAYNPNAGNAISGAFHGTLLGFPVVVCNASKKLGDLGDIMFANLDEYLLVEKGGVNASSSIHVLFNTDETAFKFTYRVNGAPTWLNSVTPENANTGFKISPFIALAAR